MPLHPEVRLKQIGQSLLLLLASLGLGLPLVDLPQTISLASALLKEEEGCRAQEDRSSESPGALVLLSAGYNVDTQHLIPNLTEMHRVRGLLQTYHTLEQAGQEPQLIILAVGPHSTDQNKLKLRNVIISTSRREFDQRPNIHKQDLPKSMFVVVEASNTEDSLRLVREELEKRGISGPIFIVTSDLHKPRSQWLACDLELDATVLGAETVLGLAQDYYSGHQLERLKLAYYLWRPSISR